MISKRIDCIADLCKGAEKLADVGCDHGYLITECYQKNGLKKAIAIDNKKMPLDNARYNISLNCNADLSVRYSLSSGINDVDKDTDTVVIAGMGGTLIGNILKDGFNLNGKPYYEKMKFILQANRNVDELREFLTNESFVITDEKIIYDEKYYEIIVCKYSNSPISLTYSEIEFGPILLKKKDEIFLRYYTEEIKKLEKICNEKTENIRKRIERIKNICL